MNFLSDIFNEPGEFDRVKAILDDIDSHYRQVWISKRSGNGRRRLLIPSVELRAAQRKLLDFLQTISGSVSRWSHGFTKDRSIWTNAAVHKGACVLLHCDIKDFFETVSPDMIRRRIFRNNRPIMHRNLRRWIQRGTLSLNRAEYRQDDEDETLDMLLRLVTYQSHVPQGCPTSPFFADRVLGEVDRRIGHNVSNRNGFVDFKYTRYADDITISSNGNSPHVIRSMWRIVANIKRVLRQFGFRLNHNKTSVRTNKGRLAVTGIVVNRKLNVPKSYANSLRCFAHNVAKDLQRGAEVDEHTLMKLRGELQFMSKSESDKIKGALKRDLEFIESHTGRNMIPKRG